MTWPLIQTSDYDIYAYVRMSIVNFNDIEKISMDHAQRWHPHKLNDLFKLDDIEKISMDSAQR